MSQTVRGVFKRATLLSLPKAILLLALSAVVLVWLFFAPEPDLSDRFGLASPPPSEYTSAAAIVLVRFPSILRHLVTLESVEFTDSSGQYVQEEAWVDASPFNRAGSSWWDSGVIEEMQRTDPAGYRIRDPDLALIFGFRIVHAPDPPTGTDGVYSAKLNLRFAGRRYTRTVAWRNYPVYLQEID